MNPKSNTLFHFTKSPETLKLILKGGFWPRYCLEDVAWYGATSIDYVAYPMVCFCDIPLSRISDHVNFYGDFGIGLTRKWAEINGLNPILYVAGENKVTSSFRELGSRTDMIKDETDKEAQWVIFRYLLAHSKPTNGTMVVDGKPVEKLFYQESEWRYVPKKKEIAEFLVKTSFDDTAQLVSANSITKSHSMLRFTPHDIRYLFVKSDSDIPDIVNFIQSELDEYPASDLKILMSRIVSLESLNDDL